MNILIYIIITGIIQGHILAFYLLLSNKGNKKANKILGLLILSFSITISHFVFYALSTYNNYPHLLLIFEPLIFTFGPLFLFYERTLISKNYIFSKTKFFHFIPAITCLAFYSPFYFSGANVKLLFVTNNSYQILIDISRNVEIIHLIQMFIYLIIINKDLKKYHNQILKSYSSLEKINLNWLKLIVILFMSVYAVVVFLLFFEILGFWEFSAIYGTKIIGVLVSLCVYIIGYRGLVQPEIFVSFENEETESKQTSKSEVAKTFDNGSMTALLDFMLDKKPYLKEDLTLAELAKQIGFSRNQLSALINSGTGENFYMFINKYRVEEVKRQLANSEKSHYTILAIAFESGFPSKSSFHNIFKKFTGITPMEFRNSLTIQESN